MKNKDYEINDELDEMLKKYYGRKPVYNFRYKKEKRGKTKFAGRKFFKYAAVLLLAVTVAAAAMIFATNLGEPSATQSASGLPKDRGFLITAYAAEVSSGDESAVTKNISTIDTVVRGGVYAVDRTYFFNSDNKYVYSISGEAVGNNSENDSYKKEVYPELVGYHIALDILGEDIKSFDVASSRGNFNYSEFNRNFENEIDFDMTPEIVAKIFDNAHIDSYDFSESKSNIEYSGKKMLFWYPDMEALKKAVDDYALSTVGVTYSDVFKTCDKSDFDKYYGAQTEFFEKNSLNSYIKDTIKITVHFNDGSSESALIEVAVNDNGDFVLKYI